MTDYVIAGKVYKITGFFKEDFLATNLCGYIRLFNCNIPKTVRVNIAFTSAIFKEYLIKFLMIPRLIDFALAFL